MSALQVRYFAAAQEAAGVADELIEIAPGATVGTLRARLCELHEPDLGPVLAISSLLVDGTVARDDAGLIGHARMVDVLPPFAGG